MKRAEVWWVDFESAIGAEITKTRPAIIISNDAANRNLNRVVVIPCTSNTFNLYPGEVIININDKSAKAMSDQIMSADKKRLKSKISELSKIEMIDLERAIKTHLGMKI